MESADETPAPVVKKIIRTVTPGYGSHEDAGMNAVGWTLFLGLVIIMLPFLPLLVIVWAISKLLEKL
ncbi:hypothetical protein DV733_05080 [Halapricum salinum]|uniref:Uncharacterized protein n=2 Tax=Halapricum salinum TaxID=1457250 RepID=A0A4D6H9A9_9EURY|nr:hypothetical protein DV733_05080 [Halapricum salinum]